MPPRPRPLRSLPRRPLLAAVLPALLAIAACGGGRGDRVPRGLTFAGATAQVEPLLERLEGLTGTPAAEDAARLRQRLAGCERFFAHCTADDATGSSGKAASDDKDGDGAKATGGLFSAATCDVVGAVACADDGLPGWAEALRGDAGWVFAGSPGSGHWLVVRGTTADNGSVTLDGEAYPAGIEGPVSLLLPASEPAGPPRMSGSESLIHVRLRPDGGLNLARFIQGGDWGARLYRLQSKLFEGTALSGVWELALYTPSKGERIPPMALALDIKDRDLAVQVMEKFLSDLMDTWPARRTDYQLGEWTGACLSNVRVMPELAPCYVATDDTLVIGWNAESVEHALAGTTNPGGALSAPKHAWSTRAWSTEGSEARIYLSRMPQADALLAEASGTTPLPRSFYPWNLLDVRGRRGADSYLFQAELEAP